MTWEVVGDEPDAPDQAWGLALLFSVNPSDRALTGWGAARCGDSLLTLLAAREHDRRKP